MRETNARAQQKDSGPECTQTERWNPCCNNDWFSLGMSLLTIRRPSDGTSAPSDAIDHDVRNS